MQNIGFIGLGIMGTPMAKNLVKAGFKLTVWNRTAEKCAPLTEMGATQAASPREVVEAADITIAMLADPTAAEAVCQGEKGVVAGIRPGKGYVDMSTVAPETSQVVATAVRDAGGLFLEAPVSGSKKPAEDGTLVILAAGDRPLFDQAQPALEAVGKKIVYLGEVGQGARMKLVVNMVMGGMMTMLCEGLTLGARSGLEPADILDVLDAGAMSNPMFRLKGPQILQGNFPPAFPLKHMQKDLRLALNLGNQLGQALHTTASANELFKTALGMGLGDGDFAAVSRVIDPSKE
jgi:3-hydroxyisobutyrate dehydrogenase-like beta-hydroxyacid dehydrogenase